MPARILVLIFILASSRACAFSRNIRPARRPAGLFYELIIVANAAAATRASAAARGGAATGSGDDTGANVGPDLHVSFLSYLRIIARCPAGPRTGRIVVTVLVIVGGAAAATTGAAAADGAAATGDCSIVHSAETSANIGSDLHVISFHVCAYSRLFRSTWRRPEYHLARPVGGAASSASPEVTLRPDDEYRVSPGPRRDLPDRVDPSRADRSRKSRRRRSDFHHRNDRCRHNGCCRRNDRRCRPEHWF